MRYSIVGPWGATSWHRKYADAIEEAERTAAADGYEWTIDVLDNKTGKIVYRVLGAQ